MTDTRPNKHTPPTQDSSLDSKTSHTTLTIIYENSPSRKIVGCSNISPLHAEIDAFKAASKKKLLVNAKMLLIGNEQKTRTAFFHRSNVYQDFIAYS